MFDNRSPKLDLFALVLLAVAVFVGVSLWTYNPTDPPSTLIHPPGTTVHNACGHVGAYAAHYLFESLGLGAWYLAGSVGVVTVLLLARREIDQPVLRAIGWAVSLVALATLLALAVPNWTPGPVIGAGGYVGAMGRGLLEMHFALAGAYIFTLSVLAAGLLLASDYFLLKLAFATTRVSGRSLQRLGRSSSFTAAAKKARVKSDLEDEVADDEQEYDDEEYEDEYDEDEAREIKVRTPADKVEALGEEDDEESDEEDEDEDSEAAGEAASAAGGPAQNGSTLAGTLKSALGLRNRVSQPAKKTEREAIIDQLEAAEQPAEEELAYEMPPLDLLLPPDDVCYEEHEREVRQKAKVLEKTFRNFGFNVRVVEIETGPVVAQYEVELEAGLRLSRITGLADDLAIALRVPSVRIVAPVPGKNTVGIEVPNENRQLVRLREVIEETNGRAKRMKIPIYLGKDVAGNPMVVDLAALPHLLIAGRTGTGKSVCLNSIIVSLLMTRGPDEVRMLMIDPKMVELNGYRRLPHLMHPVVTDMRKAEAILGWAVDKMEERYQLLSRAGVRHVSVYNQLGDEELRERIEPENEEEWRHIPRQLPYIVIVADELADLMMTAGKDVEQHIIRLAQKSRAVGIHLILATQKPTVDVITGLIKSNLPARIAFQVASRVDSRVVLDEMGAEKLLGNGDMLFLLPGTSTLLRGQGTYLSDDEISGVVDFVATDAPQFASELINLKTKDEIEAAGAGGFKNRDEFYEAAVDIVVRERRGSVSLLQRALGIGYGRAARLIDFMAEDGIVGEYNGSQAREVLISLEQWDAMSQADESAGADGNVATNGASVGTTATLRRNASTAGQAAATLEASVLRPRRSNKIFPEPEEPSELEDETDELEDGVYDDEDLDEDEWEEDEDGEEDSEEEEPEDDEGGEYEEEEWEEEDADEEGLDDEEEEEEWEDEELEEDETT